MPCSARQDLLARALIAIAAKTGQFTRDAGCDGAGYMDAGRNTGARVGFRCENCVFFRTPQACVIMRGRVERAGICRLHIVPQDRLVQSGLSGSCPLPRSRLEGSVVPPVPGGRKG